ncbi:hypothetical protein SDC9_115392 [bioreactor metagenome]|uniref:Uncharacterized protein n=1 Tax=bioreactor metagenome TaxID=1076179 RepID=A0A645BSQ7_9ZZZZ
MVVVDQNLGGSGVEGGLDRGVDFGGQQPVHAQPVLCRLGVFLGAIFPKTESRDAFDVGLDINFHDSLLLMILSNVPRTYRADTMEKNFPGSQ